MAVEGGMLDSTFLETQEREPMVVWVQNWK